MIINLMFDTDSNSIDITDEYGEALEELEMFDALDTLRDALDIITDPSSERVDTDILAKHYH